MKFTLVFTSLVSLSLFSQVALAGMDHVDCSAKVEKYFIHEGEEGTGPKTKVPYDVKLHTVKSEDTLVKRGSIDGLEIIVDMDENIDISVMLDSEKFMMARTVGNIDSSGRGPNLSLQYRIPSVTDVTGETQQATLTVRCYPTK